MPFSEPTIKIAPPPSPTDRQKMVGWFDPGPLIGVATNVLVSTLFGRHSDYRLVEALATQGAEEEYDFSLKDGAPRQELWLDYTADTGDGFDSTYAVAYWLTRDNLDAVGPDGATQRTRCGDVLVLGGDLVYPSASRGDYHRKLVRPFETARNYSRAPEPYIFALPGNHDWYDSLVSFSRLFCSGRWFQGWRTAQKRSYFALKLPHNWWLLGADVQLGSDIDAFQVEYFKKVASRMQPGDRVILCTAEPHWIYSADVVPRRGPRCQREQHRVLREGAPQTRRPGRSLSRRRLASLSATRRRRWLPQGDRGWWWSVPPSHPRTVHRQALGRLRAQGGISRPGSLAAHGMAQPALSVHQSQVRRRHRSHLRVHRLVLVPGGPSACSSASPSCAVGSCCSPTPTRCGTGASPARSRRRQRGDRGGPPSMGGPGHRRDGRPCDAPRGPHRDHPLRGRLDLRVPRHGLYFLLSLNVFGRHSNEAFSALRIPDFKHFLRLHIDGDGRLTLFPLGIDRVPRDWKPAAFSDGYAAQLVPDDPRATPPRSIEPAVVIGG